MPVVVDREACNACNGSRQPPCVRLCPGDLMFISSDHGKAELRADADCWDCYACVKGCPQEALEVRLSYQVALRGASVRPHILSSDKIEWTAVDRQGNVEQWVIPTKWLPVALDEPSENGDGAPVKRPGVTWAI